MSYQKLIESVLPQQGRSGNNIIYRCPNCEGSTGSGHLYVNYDKNVYNCFKCGFKSRDIKLLVSRLGFDVTFDYDRMTNVTPDLLKDAISSLSKSKRTIDIDYSRDLEFLTMYFSAHVKPLSDKAIEYLYSRGIYEDKMSKYFILEGINRSGESFELDDKSVKGRDYSGRIMIPSIQRDGKISFYVARDYTGRRYSKYVNPPSELAYASEDVWNLDMVDSKSVIVCEGVFTAMTAGGSKGNAVATYGKKVSHISNSDNKMIRVSSQGEKLLSRKFDRYYVVYDADAHSEGMDTANWLQSRGANVYIVYIDPLKYGDKADVDSIGYEEFLKLLVSSKRYDPLDRVFRG